MVRYNTGCRLIENCPLKRGNFALFLFRSLFNPPRWSLVLRRIATVTCPFTLTGIALWLVAEIGRCCAIRSVEAFVRIRLFLGLGADQAQPCMDVSIAGKQCYKVSANMLKSGVCCADTLRNCWRAGYSVVLVLCLSSIASSQDSGRTQEGLR